MTTDAPMGEAMASRTTTVTEVRVVRATAHHVAGPLRRASRVASAMKAKALPMGSTRGTSAKVIASASGNLWRQNRATQPATVTRKETRARRTAQVCSSTVATPVGENPKETVEPRKARNT